MVAVKPPDVERALRSLPAGIQLLLLYGPDAGLVNERARKAAESVARDPADPFQLVRMDGDSVADRPARLVEEASTYSLLAGPRVIRVGPTSRNISGAVAECLAAPLPDTLIVVEAGDLQRSSPLRAACEASPLALALPCYPDSERDLAAVVDGFMAAANLRFEGDARALLLASLGEDRLSSRTELEKLTLFCHGQETVSEEDVEAVISDASGLSIDAALDAAFSGRVAAWDAVWAQHQARGTSPAALLSGALRHALALSTARARLDEGDSPDTAMTSWRGLSPRRRAAVQQQLSRWPTATLADVVSALQAATLRSRQMAQLSSAVTAASLYRIASYPGSRSRTESLSARQSASSWSRDR
ncbi:DNA polymerase III subunit delta [Enterovirga sp.]|jgi:DNA polymerase-3 subunit delta|uniref:DNA polymerase III subunit delta n=1 Tax=Enterovirga sp. TaxID=2026350 RepID=UPI0026106655|nr:DNA polymerase III subunit delta [Enterovirga sp.]MDB5590213.1 polymerase subunit delta [Enterovirga sp.]